MKAHHFIQILLGGFLALQVCVKSGAQPTPEIIFSSSDFSVIGDQANKKEAMANAPNFSAAGTITTPLDGSSASGAQTIAFGGGIFRGSGQINTHTGLYNGKVSEIAAGETSVFIRFELTNAYYYQFEASVFTIGDIDGVIMFNGNNYSNGQFTANGILGTNQYDLRAFLGSGTNNQRGEGTWSYLLSLVPANIDPGRFTEAQKTAFYSQFSEQEIIASQLINSADAALTSAQRNELLAAADRQLGNRRQF